MTAKELIEKLSTLDPETQIVVSEGDMHIVLRESRIGYFHHASAGASRGDWLPEPVPGSTVPAVLLC